MMEPNHEDSSSESDNEVGGKRRGTNSADRGCRQKKQKQAKKRNLEAKHSNRRF